jgi:hypothetical protein
MLSILFVNTDETNNDDDDNDPIHNDIINKKNSNIVKRIQIFTKSYIIN